MVGENGQQLTKAFILSETELAVLMSVIGAERFFGIRLKAVSDLDEQEVCHAVFSLLRNGFLIKDESKTTVRPELDGLLRGLAGAKRFWMLSPADAGLAESYIYEGTSTAVIRPMGQQGDMIRLAGLADETLLDYVMREGFCVPNTLDCGDDRASCVEIKLTEEELEDYASLWRLGKESASERGSMRALLTCYDTLSGKKLEMLYIQSLGVDDRLVCIDERGAQAYVYTEGGCRSFLEEKGGLI